MLLNIRIQWNAGTACVSECVLKLLAGRGLRVPTQIMLELISMCDAFVDIEKPFLGSQITQIACEFTSK